MMKKILVGNWTFWASGIFFGAIIMLLTILMNSSLAMEDAYGLLLNYFETAIEERGISRLPFLNWQTGFIGGIIIGAFISSAVTGDFKIEIFPDDRKEKALMPSLLITPLHGIISGFILMLGIQLAGGSFLGQWAGVMQFSISSWIFIGAAVFSGFFAVLIMSANLEGGGDSK